MTLHIESLIFSLENCSPLQSLHSVMVLYNSVYYLSLGVSIQVCSHVASSLFKGENSSAILTGKRINNYDALAETLKGLTINKAVYFN